METRSTTKRKLESKNEESTTSEDTSLKTSESNSEEEQVNKKVAVDHENASTTSEEETSSDDGLKTSGLDSDEDLSYDSNFGLPEIFSPQGGTNPQYQTPFTDRASRVFAPNNVNGTSPFPYIFNNTSDLGTPSTPNATNSYYQDAVLLGSLFMSPSFGGSSDI